MKNNTLLIVFLLTSIIVLANPDTSKVTESLTVETKKENSKIPDYAIYTVITFIGIAIGGAWIKYLFDRTVKQIESDYTEKMKEKLKDIDSQIAKAFNDKQENVDMLLEKADHEKMLLKTKEILIWGETDNTIIKRVLRNIGFNITDNLFEEETDGIRYDLLFINNEGGSLEMVKVLNKIKSLSNKQVAFYYNLNNIRLDTTKLKGLEDKVNFVNSAAQIYGNLLNTLKYQDKISKN